MFRRGEFQKVLARAQAFTCRRGRRNSRNACLLAYFVEGGNASKNHEFKVYSEEFDRISLTDAADGGLHSSAAEVTKHDGIRENVSCTGNP